MNIMEVGGEGSLNMVLSASFKPSSTCLSLSLFFKVLTYGASATLHLYSFTSASSLARAFTMDLLCVPFSAVGSLVPFVHFVEKRQRGGIGESEEGGEGGGVRGFDETTLSLFLPLTVSLFLVNTACVLHQTAGQVGLKPQLNKSDTPRSAVLAAYVVYAIGCLYLFARSLSAITAW